MMDMCHLHIALMIMITLHVIKDAMTIAESCSQNGDMLDCYGRNLSHIPTVSSAVTTVNLESNRLGSVMSDSFEGATSLSILSFDNNLIRNLQVDWAKHLVSLHRLSINNNLLTALHNATFVGLGILRSLLLSHNKITTLFPGWCDGVYNVTLVDLSENKITSISRRNWCLFTRLEFLNLSNNEIIRLHSNWTEGMVHLKYLYLQNNHLQALNNDSFSFLTSLYALQLSNNSIKTVEGGWGRDLGKLTSIQLSQNKLKKLPPNLFYGMVHLTRIDMKAANVRIVHKDSFKFLEGLEEMSLQHNSITIINEGDFIDMRSVERLQLQFNEIHRLESRSFWGMASLVEIYLNNNRLVSLLRDTFAGLHTLTHLYLQNNNIGSLTECWSVDLNNILYIDMSRNNISIIENELSNQSHCGNSGPTDLVISERRGKASSRNTLQVNTVFSLRILYLSRNPIGPVLHQAVFKGLAQLRYLMLSYCNLESIEESFFTGLDSLKYLDISGNNIVRLDSNAFGSLPSVVAIIAKHNSIESVGPKTFDGKRLSFVDLHKNALQTLSRDVLPKRFSAFELRLSRNPIVCDCRITWLHKLITKERIRTVDLSFLSTVDFIFPSFVDVTPVKCANMHGSRLNAIPLKYIPCHPSLNFNVTTHMMPPVNEFPKTTSGKHLTSIKISTKGINSPTNPSTMSTLLDVQRNTAVPSPGRQNDAIQDKGTSQTFSTTNTFIIIIGLLLVIIILFAGKQLSQCGQNCKKTSIRARSVIYQDINNSLIMRTSDTRSSYADPEDTNPMNINRNPPRPRQHVRLTSCDFGSAPPTPPPRHEALVQTTTLAPTLWPNALGLQGPRIHPVVASKPVAKHTYFCRSLGDCNRDRSLTASTSHLEDGNTDSEILAKPQLHHVYFRNLVGATAGNRLGRVNMVNVQENKCHCFVTEDFIHEKSSDLTFIIKEASASSVSPTETTGCGPTDQDTTIAARHYFLDSDHSTCWTSNSTSLQGDDFERDHESHENGDDIDDTSDVIVFDINQDELPTRITGPAIVIDELAVASYSLGDGFDNGMSTPEMDSEEGSDYGLDIFELEIETLSNNGYSFELSNDDSQELELETLNLTEAIIKETLV